MSAISTLPTSGRGEDPLNDTLSGKMTVLVVDDNPIDRRVAGRIVDKQDGCKAVYAGNGEEALAMIEEKQPRLVLTDLQMPEMDGLVLVEEIRERFPQIPVILMTAKGSEQIAIQALRSGAAYYVPKRNLAEDLPHTLEQVLSSSRVERRQQLLLERLAETESYFILENDRSFIPVLIDHFQVYLSRLRLCDATGKTRIGIALEEALVNAMYHGNLEASSDLRQGDDDAPFHQLIEERKKAAPYRDRKIHFKVRLSPTEAVYIIRDEGPGFDPSRLPDPTDPANLEKASGRGVLLIRTFMDEVVFNATGNEITMIKRRD